MLLLLMIMMQMLPCVANMQQILIHVECSGSSCPNLMYNFPPAGALSLQEFLWKTGLDSHVLLGNHLISLLMSIGCVSGAHHVFNRSLSWSEQAWRALVTGYIRSGHPQDALRIFQNMRQSFGHSFEHVFAALLNACTKLRDVETGYVLHAEICRLALETNLFIASSLLYMYANCGFIVKAREVFDMLPIRNVITWNAIMAGYSKHAGDGEKTIEFFEKMQLEGLSPDAVSFVLVLKSCSTLRALGKGLEMHTKIGTLTLLEEDPYIGSSLVDMYVNCACLTQAQKVFDKLLLRDAVLWNALIGGYAKHGYGEEALNCFHRMQEEGFSPTPVTYACSLKACGSVGSSCIEKAQQIHDEIIQRGLDREMFVGSSLVDMYAKYGLLSNAEQVFDRLVMRNVVSWNCLIAGYVKHGYNEEALRCFELMQVQRLEDHAITPTTVTFVCSLKACSNMGAIYKGTQIHAAIVRKGLQSDMFIASALVDMYATCGLLPKAHQLFAQLPILTTASSTYCRNALVAGYAQLGEMGALFQILSKQNLEGGGGGRAQMINPLSLVTMVSILNACSHAGLVDYAVEAIMTMINGNDVAIQEHYNCLVDILGRAGQVERAICVVAGMPFHPNIVVWHTLLGACRKWRHNMDVARMAFHEIFGLDEGDSSAYFCMLNNMYTTNSAIMLEEIQTSEAMEEICGPKKSD